MFLLFVPLLGAEFVGGKVAKSTLEQCIARVSLPMLKKMTATSKQFPAKVTFILLLLMGVLYVDFHVVRRKLFTAYFARDVNVADLVDLRFVGLDARFERGCVVAIAAFKRLLRGVRLFMLGQAGLMPERLSAHFADERLFIFGRVDFSDVLLDSIFSEFLTANLARNPGVRRMNLVVVEFEVALARKGFVTSVAFVWRDQIFVGRTLFTWSGRYIVHCKISFHLMSVNMIQ